MNAPAPVRNAVLELETGLKSLYGERFRGLLLYGSYARGDQREGSDVNLLLLLKGPVNTVQEILHLETLAWPLSLEATLTLSVMPASIEDFEQAKTKFLRIVRREAIPVAAWASYNRTAMNVLPPKIRDAVRQLEAGFKEFYGERFRGLVLYGSYARGTAWEGSDVDLLLLLDGPVNPAREIMREPVSCPISLDSGVVLSVIPMSFQIYQKGDSLFLDSIRQDAIPVAA